MPSYSCLPAIYNLQWTVCLSIGKLVTWSDLTLKVTGVLVSCFLYHNSCTFYKGSYSQFEPISLSVVVDDLIYVTIIRDWSTWRQNETRKLKTRRTVCRQYCIGKVNVCSRLSLGDLQKWSPCIGLLCYKTANLTTVLSRKGRAYTDFWSRGRKPKAQG